MKKIVPIILVLLLAGGGGFFFMKKGGEETHVEQKIDGVLLTMNPEFLLNLSDGSVAKFTVTLLLEHDDHGAHAIVEASSGGHGPPDPSKLPPHPQNAVLRAIITDEVGAASSEEMLDAKKRSKVLKHIKEAFKEETDAHVKRVLISDIIVD